MELINSPTDFKILIGNDEFFIVSENRFNTINCIFKFAKLANRILFTFLLATHLN